MFYLCYWSEYAIVRGSHGKNCHVPSHTQTSGDHVSEWRNGTFIEKTATWLDSWELKHKMQFVNIEEVSETFTWFWMLTDSSMAQQHHAILHSFPDIYRYISAHGKVYQVFPSTVAYCKQTDTGVQTAWEWS